MPGGAYVVNSTGMFLGGKHDAGHCGERTLRPTHTKLGRLTGQARVEVAFEPVVLLTVQLAVGHSS